MDQEIIRTMYFQNNNPIHTCNGKKEEFEREVVQDSRNIRGVFIEMIVVLKKKPDMNENDFQSMLVPNA